MDATDHRRIISELDELGREVAGTIQQFETAGVTAIMKDDYVALHVLEHRIAEMRIEHVRALDALSSNDWALQSSDMPS